MRQPPSLMMVGVPRPVRASRESDGPPCCPQHLHLRRVDQPSRNHEQTAWPGQWCNAMVNGVSQASPNPSPQSPCPRPIAPFRNETCDLQPVGPLQARRIGDRPPWLACLGGGYDVIMAPGHRE